MTTIIEPKSPAPVQHRHDDALLEQQEGLRVTLASIGDAVITVDPTGLVTLLNPVSESLTGWKRDEAVCLDLEDLFKIVDEESHLPVENLAGLGRGSEFTVRRPVLHSQPKLPDPNPAKIAEHSAQGSRILVVDDNEDSANVLAELLMRSGHVVRTAYAGPTAIDVATEYLPDLVLLDIGLPGINGYEVARRLRQLPHLDRIKIVAMTGFGQDSDIRFAHEAGFDSHQVKPINFAKMLEFIGTMLSRPSTKG